jgi:sugar lactone lactonase YvrE
MLGLVAGSPSVSGASDGAAVSAMLNGPWSTAVDSDGNVYVADRSNYTIRKISPVGIVTTVAGVAGQPGSADGYGPFARFAEPCGVAVDRTRTLYVAECSGHVIRKVSPDGKVSTFAGYPGYSGYFDSTGASARFNYPHGVAVDPSGNILVSDYGNAVIRKISADGVVTTVAGTPMSGGYRDGPAAQALFNGPIGLTTDSTGQIFVAEYYNQVIRKIAADGTVSAVAGIPGGTGYVDGPSSTAQFNRPVGVALNASGTIFVSDQANHVIRAVTGAVVSTFAGMGGVYGGADGTGSNARFYNPANLSIDSQGNLYVPEGSHVIRKVSPSAVVTTLAGVANSAGSTDGTSATSARFNQPAGVEVDGTGAVFVADSQNHEVRKVLPSGVVTTVAGNPWVGGVVDGAGVAASFYFPYGIARSASGDLYVADGSGHTIRRIDSSGMVTTFAGAAYQCGSVDGAGTDARFCNPYGMAVDASGNVFVADYSNHTIRKISPQRQVTTYAGSAGQAGSTDGVGGSARFNNPVDLTIDGSGNLLVSDMSNCKVRAIDQSRAVTTFAGTGVCGFANGARLSAQFNGPMGITIDDAGSIYVADYSNHVIRQISTDGMITTFAGSPNQPAYADGTASVARFNSPYGIAFDRTTGNIVVGDLGNYAIRTITPSQVVATLAGTPLQPGLANGIGTARFNLPYGVAADGSGNYFVSDTENHTIRMIAVNGVVTTIAGSPGQASFADGVGADARFSRPTSLAMDANDHDLYVIDSSNNAVRRLVRSASAPYTYSVDTIAAPPRVQLSTPTALAVYGGFVYVADTNNHVIRKIATTAPYAASVFAGTVGISGSTDGIGSAARFNGPRGITVDGTGIVYVGDTNNHTIRKITSDQKVTRLAGYPGLTGTVDGTGDNARFSSPSGLTVDAAGSVYVADSGNYLVRKVTTTGVVSTLVGIPGTSGTPTELQQRPQPLPARIDTPRGLAVDRRSGAILIAAGSAVLVASNPLALSIPGLGYFVPRGESQTLTATGGRGDYTWTFVTNNSGGSLTASGGYVAGSKSGVLDTVMVKDGIGNSATATVTVVAPLTVPGGTNPTIPTGASQTLTASGGSGSYAWWIVSNNSGASLTSDGVYTAGTTVGATDTVEVLDTNGTNGELVHVTVVPPPPVSVPALPYPFVIVAFAMLLAIGTKRGRART